MKSYVTREEAEKIAHGKLLLKMSSEQRAVLRDPFQEKAALFFSNSDEDPNWVEKFVGTPFIQQAVELERAQMQLDMERTQMNKSESDFFASQQQQQDILRQKADALKVQRKMLMLQMLEGGPTAPPGGLPPPPPDAAMLAPEEVKAAMDRGREIARRDFAKMAAPPVIGFGSKMMAGAKAIMSGGMKPGTLSSWAKPIGEAVLPSMALGAVGNAMTKGEDESYLGAAARGAMGGVVPGLVGAGIQGGMNLHGKIQAQRAGNPNMSYGRAAQDVAQKGMTNVMTPEARTQFKTNLSTLRQQPVTPPAAPRPPAQLGTGQPNMNPTPGNQPV
jgi:hypothetical protein